MTIIGMLMRLMCCCSHINLSTPRPLTLVATYKNSKTSKNVFLLYLMTTFSSDQLGISWFHYPEMPQHVDRKRDSYDKAGDADR